MLKFQYRGSTKSVWLIGPVMKVGSSKASEIILTDEGIAPLHCYIHVSDNHVEIEPIADNQVFVNEMLVLKRMPIKMQDVTRIGVQEFVIIDPQNKAAIVPQPVQPISSEATVFRAPPAVVSDASGWMLQGLHQSLRNKRFPVDGTMYVGRAPECELHFSFERLSRKHAELKVMDGVLMLKDLDSSNGTFHNGEKIKQAKLHGGDTIAFDKLEFTVIAPVQSGSPVMQADNMNQTVVRSAITPEMLKHAKAANAQPAASKPVKVDNAQPEKSGSANTILLVAAAVVAVGVIAAIIMMM